MPGQIIERGERTWLVRVYTGRDAQGKRQYVGHTVHGTKKDAQTWLNNALREKDLGTFAGVQHTTMNALFDDVLEDYRVNGQDHEWAEGVVRVRLRPHFGAMKASKVGTAEIRKFVAAKQEQGMANATINRALALLRRAFNLAKKATPPKVGTVPHVPMLKENNVRKGFFEHEPFLAVRRALPEEIRPVITFGFYTGCRKEEILGLRWPQVDLAERVVRLEPGETKNDEARTIPLVAELHEMLVLLKEARDRWWPDSPWVFSRAGERIRSFRGAWESACKAAGLVDASGEPERLFHDLRRTGVRNLVRAGVPEKVAMAISGHKSRSVFDRYNIVSESDLREAARKLGDYMAHRGTPEPAAADPRHTTGTHEPPAPVN
jgi:integrase